MANQWSGENNHVKILRALARRSPQTSRELAAEAGMEVTRTGTTRTNQRASVRANAILAAEHGHGHVKPAGYRTLPYNNSRAALWRITPAGRAWLKGGTWKLGEPQREKWARHAAWRDALIEYADREATAHGWGYDTVPSERMRAMRQMREVGCSLQIIADIFGVTREYARLIVRGWSVRNGVQLPVNQSGKLRRGGHYVKVEEAS